jgi:predicted nucleotidyltransferase
MSAVRDVLRALTIAKVRYVVVGGVAVVLHGYMRATKDVDLVIDLAPAEARKALTVLREMGLQPTVPVDALQFADPEKRREWIEQKNMLVFQMRDQRRNVDIFVDYPIPFDELWDQSLLLPIEDVTVRVASIPHLIEMKRRAGRPEDLIDIEKLTLLEQIRAKTSE